MRSGIRDILIANEIAGESQLRRFVELSAEVPVIVAVDNATVVHDMARLARSRGIELNVLVDVDLGLKRCGMRRESLPSRSRNSSSNPA